MELRRLYLGNIYLNLNISRYIFLFFVCIGLKYNKGDLAAVKSYFENGTDIEKRYRDGQTALHFSAESGNLKYYVQKKIQMPNK